MKVSEYGQKKKFVENTSEGIVGDAIADKIFLRTSGLLRLGFGD